MFGHIAHFDIHGFWGAQFSTTQARLGFLRGIALYRCYGDPAWTWSDVERDIRNCIIGSGLIDAYTRALAAEQEARDRADLARLHSASGTPCHPNTSLSLPRPCRPSFSDTGQRKGQSNGSDPQPCHRHWQPWRGS